jgi:hypothetical protein
VDGVAESLVKSKKYLLPLVVLNPEFTGAVVVAYLTEGRMRLPKNAKMFEVDDAEYTGGPLRPVILPGETVSGKPGKVASRP